MLSGAGSGVHEPANQSRVGIQEGGGGLKETGSLSVSDRGGSVAAVEN